MIIVEGTDLIGKTTLCEALVKGLNSLGCPHIYAHFTKLPATFQRVWHYKPFINRFVVRDRFYMSRMAYGMAFDNQPLLNETDYRTLDAWCRLVGAYHVVVLADDETIEQQWDAKQGEGEMYDLDGIKRVNKLFRDFVQEPAIAGVYRMDIDNVISTRCSGGNWPSNKHTVQNILDDYCARQRDLSMIARAQRVINPEMDHDPLR